jgi:lysozyme
MDLETQLRRDEGERLTVYLDSRGIRTAGVGRNLEVHGIDLPVGAHITQQQSDEWLQQDIANAKSQLLAQLPWASELDDARLGVLINMTFNLGIHGLLGFHHTLTLIQAKHYDMASEAMLQSTWSQQVGNRAIRLAVQMESGVWT